MNLYVKKIGGDNELEVLRGGFDLRFTAATRDDSQVEELDLIKGKEKSSRLSWMWNLITGCDLKKVSF